MKSLNQYELRVIGALIEKKITTPDQYPLSLNALTNACNQKSNRDPVLNMSETLVQSTVDELRKANLVSEVVFGSRVPKYQHRFCNTEFSQIRLSSAELAVMCCLMLRGTQTPGELRTRTNRLHEFKDIEQVESTLQELIDRDGDPLVKKLGREPGKREVRFAHLLSGEPADTLSSENIHFDTQEFPRNNDEELPSTAARILALEETVKSMQQEIDWLKQQWDELNSPGN